MKVFLYAVCLWHLCFQLGIYTKDLIVSTLYLKSRRNKDEDKDK